MTKNKFTIAILTLCICSFMAFGQNKTDSLLNLLKTAKHDTSKVKTYVALCDAYMNSNPKKALLFGQQGLQLAEKVKFKKGIAVCSNNIGIVYNKQGIYDKAIEYFFKALKIYEELHDKKGITNCYINIGTIHFNQSNYSKALVYFFKALKTNEKLDYKKGMAACYNNIGLVYSEQAKLQRNTDSISNNYNKAIEYYKKSLTIAEELYRLHPEYDWKKGMALCCNNIGIIYFNQGNYNKALEFYQRALNIDEQLKDKNGTISVLINISDLHITLSDSKAITQNEKKKHLSEALDYSQKAYILADEIKALPLMNAAAANLQKIYKKQNKPFKALEYAEIFITTKNSMFKEEKTKALAEMETKYETEKKEKEIIIKNNQIQNLVNDRRVTTNKFYALICTIILLLIIGILYYSRFKLKNIKNLELMEKNRQIHETQKALVDAELKNTLIEKQKIETELIYKNKEIENLALHIVQKNDFLENLNNLILENKIAVKTKEEQRKIDNLMNIINSQINLDKDREEFQIYIEQVNINFFLKLTERFSDITEKEKRLCALLKLNMTSKKIASLLNISSGTVDMNRHHLRKKFNIESEESLTDFLNSL